MSRIDRASFHMTNDPFEASRDDKYEYPRLSFRGQISVDTHIDCGGLRLPMKITANPSREEVPGQDFLTFALEVQCGNHGIADADVTRLARSEAFQIAKRYVQATAWNLQKTAVNISRSGLQTLRTQRHATTGAANATPRLCEGQFTERSLPSGPIPLDVSGGCRASFIASPNDGIECSSDVGSRSADLRRSQQPPGEVCSHADVSSSLPVGTNTSMSTTGVHSIDNRNHKNANAVLPPTCSPSAQVGKRGVTRKKRRGVDTGELKKSSATKGSDLADIVLKGALVLKERQEFQPSAKTWSDELFQLNCPDSMGFQDLVGFFTVWGRTFTYRRWEANLLAHLARVMLQNESPTATQLSFLSRQRKYLAIPLNLVNAAYRDVGRRALNIFSALGGEWGQCAKTVFRG